MAINILQNVWKNALNEIIDETQCGFMKGRHISSNIRLVIYLVQYSNLLNGDPLLLFLDFRKAFDYSKP